MKENSLILGGEGSSSWLRPRSSELSVLLTEINTTRQVPVALNSENVSKICLSTFALSPTLLWAYLQVLHLTEYYDIHDLYPKDIGVGIFWWLFRYGCSPPSLLLHSPG